jgi:hypothetical protein
MVYDPLGREVRRIGDEMMQPGIHTAVVDRSSLPSGVYFCRLAAGEFVATKRLLMLK